MYKAIICIPGTSPQASLKKNADIYMLASTDWSFMEEELVGSAIVSFNRLSCNSNRLEQSACAQRNNLGRPLFLIN